MYENLTSESRTLLFVLISSLLSFRRVNIRYLELNIPQVCNGFLIFREWELRVCIFTIRERASFVMFSIAVQVLFMCVHSFWCHLINSNDCSKFRFPFIRTNDYCRYFWITVICSVSAYIYRTLCHYSFKLHSKNRFLLLVSSCWIILIFTFLQCGIGNILPYKEQVGYCVVYLKKRVMSFVWNLRKTKN